MTAAAAPAEGVKIAWMVAPEKTAPERKTILKTAAEVPDVGMAAAQVTAAEVAAADATAAGMTVSEMTAAVVTVAENQNLTSHMALKEKWVQGGQQDQTG